MTRPNMHTIKYNNKVYTLSQNGVQRLTGRSRTFLASKMIEAAGKGIPPEKRMQYAIEQEPADISKNSRGNQHACSEGQRRVRHEKLMNKHKQVVNRFLLGGE